MRNIFSRDDGVPKGDVRGAVDRLSELNAFPGATRADLRRIIEAGRLVRAPEHWSVIVDHTPADKAYVILEGSVSILRDGEEVAVLGAGDVVGEQALIERQLRSATVVAGEGLVMLHLDRAAFNRLRAEVPAFGAVVDGVAAARIG